MTFCVRCLWEPIQCRSWCVSFAFVKCARLKKKKKKKLQNAQQCDDGGTVFECAEFNRCSKDNEVRN